LKGKEEKLQRRRLGKIKEDHSVIIYLAVPDFLPSAVEQAESSELLARTTKRKEEVRLEKEERVREEVQAYVQPQGKGEEGKAGGRTYAKERMSSTEITL